MNQDVDLKPTKLTKLLGRAMRRRPAQRRRGQALIEMALVMTVLLILTFGMADFGLFLTGHIQASNCAREVARRAVVRDPDATNSCNEGQLALFESSTIIVNPDPWVCKPAKSPVTATVEGTYRWIAIGPLLNALIPGSAWPTHTTTRTNMTMRMEALLEGTC